MNDLITVIINVYNGEKFISKCLDCIVNQTYKNLEILIINDGSTDNTLSICKSYKDKRIKVITTENKGLSLSRNIGIENAKGKYLYFIDVDDWIELDTIEYLYDLCTKYDVSCSSCKSIDVFDYGVPVYKISDKSKILSSEEMLKMILLAKDRAGTIWNKLIKAELFDDIKFENRIINDVVVTHKVIINAKEIAYGDQIKYYYLRHRNSITGKETMNTIRSIDRYKAIMERYYYIKKLYPKMKENEICLIRILIILFCSPDEKLQKYLNQEKAMKLFKKIFTYKVFICDIKFKEKIKILLFKINPRLCKFIYKKYQNINYKYKM